MFRRLLEDRQGNVAVIFGLCLPVLGIGMGFAVDYSNGTRQQADLQNAADAAALAGARELGLSTGNKSERETLATATAKRFLGTRAAKMEQTVESSVDDGSVMVQVAVESPQYFGALIGRKTQTISAAAKATYAVDKPSGCLVALSRTAPVGIEIQGNPNISAPKCGIWSNSDSDRSIVNRGAGNIKAGAICAVGSVSGNGRGLNPAAEENCDPSPDPYAGRTLPTGGTCNFTNFSASKGATLGPGTYCGGLSLVANGVTLSPGLYVVKGPLKISGSFSGTGVSILLTGPGANFDLSGNETLSLSAMTTGPLAGIAIAMADDGVAKTASMQGTPRLNLAGSLYFPSTHLDMKGTPEINLTGTRDKFVAHSFDMQGTPDINIAADESTAQDFDITALRLIR
jgi:Flp pilus assembly protein TadG